MASITFHHSMPPNAVFKDGDGPGLALSDVSSSGRSSMMHQDLPLDVFDVNAVDTDIPLVGRTEESSILFKASSEDNPKA